MPVEVCPSSTRYLFLGEADLDRPQRVFTWPVIFLRSGVADPAFLAILVGMNKRGCCEVEVHRTQSVQLTDHVTNATICGHMIIISATGDLAVGYVLAIVVHLMVIRSP